MTGARTEVRTPLLLLGFLLLACTGLEIALERDPDVSGGAAGTTHGGAGDSGAGNDGGRSGASGNGGTTTAGGVPGLVCSGDNWTSDEIACSQGVAPSCDGTPIDWAGCRGTGCAVCENLVADYPYYFDRHPCCQRRDQCDDRTYPCHVACPRPDVYDKIPLCDRPER